MDFSDSTQYVTLPISEDVAFALNQEKDAVEKEFRLLLAIKYYELGRLTSGLAAKMAGVSRTAFFHILSHYQLSPFGTETEELEEDLANAKSARHQ